MMARAQPDRIEVLANRVRWFDHHRRKLSVLLGLIVWVLLSRKLAALFQSDWPGVGSGLLGAAFGAVVWWVIEIAFAWMIAMWETEYEQLASERGMPRAKLVTRK